MRNNRKYSPEFKISCIIVIRVFFISQNEIFFPINIFDILIKWYIGV